MSNYTIREYQKGDEVKINLAFNQIFKQNRSVEEWFWKFEPDKGKSRILLALDEKGEILAHYAGFLVSMNINGRRFTCAQSLDSFSLNRKDVLKNRVFIKIYEEYCRLYGGEHDVPYFYGCNGGRIMLGALKLNYTTPQPVTYLNKETKRYQRALGKFIRNRVWQWFARQRPFEISELNSLWENSSERYDISIVKNGNYIQHRYIKHPNRKYIYITSRKNKKIDALAILKYDVGKLHWVDLVWDGVNSKSLASLEKNIWHLALLLGAVEVEMWLNNDTQAQEILMACGMNVKDNPYDLFVSSRSFTEDIDGEDVTSRLYFTMGDTDMF